MNEPATADQLSLQHPCSMRAALQFLALFPFTSVVGILFICCFFDTGSVAQSGLKLAAILLPLVAGPTRFAPLLLASWSLKEVNIPRKTSDSGSRVQVLSL